MFLKQKEASSKHPQTPDLKLSVKNYNSHVPFFKILQHQDKKQKQAETLKSCNSQYCHSNRLLE